MFTHITAAVEFTFADKKMDEIEGGILSSIPVNALTLRLTRSAIRMQHSPTWGVDKFNDVEDLVIAIEGRGEYLVEEERFTLEPGEAMLIRRGTRFRGWTSGPGLYIGLAQHFTLDLHGRHDLIAQMDLRRKIRFPRWDLLDPMVRHYRQSAPANSVTLAQHHLFMYLLTTHIEAAFLGWGESSRVQADRAEGMELAIVKAASVIAADPLNPDIAQTAVDAAPYNTDYFLREFQRRIGWTPRKYQELKRMDRATHLLESGLSVARVAHEVGYSDPYYFSRMFKKMIGLSPRQHMQRLRLTRDGNLMNLDEREQLDRLNELQAKAISLG